jgi:hypothetical protein
VSALLGFCAHFQFEQFFAQETSMARFRRMNKLGTGLILTLVTCGCSAAIDDGSAEELGESAQALYGPTLPTGWNKTKIGAANGAVAANYDPDTGNYRITGSGVGMFQINGQKGADNFYFVNKTVTGDGEVSMFWNTYDGPAELNIDVRSQLNSTSSHVQLGRSSTIYRKDINGPVTTAGYNYAGTWTKLVRRGNTITGYSSADGFYWTPANPPVSVTLGGIGAAAYFGVEVAGGSATATANAELDSMVAGALPLSLTAQGIGGPTPSGSTTIDYQVNGGTFTVKGGGAGVKGTSDSFQFTYRPLVGDGTIIAQVEPPNGTSVVNAGLMLRKSLSSNSSNVFVSMDNQDELLITSRATSGGSTTAPERFNKGSYGGWIKLTRVGNTISSYSSVDGVNWTSFQSATLSDLGSSVYVGIAIASGQNGTLATTTVDSFKFLPNADQP